MIAIIGFVHSTMVAKNYARKHNYVVSSNRELVAYGMVNTCGSFFGAYPAFASLSRSSVNDLAGCKSQLSGFITSIIVLLTMLFLTSLFYYLPMVVMASIIIVATIGLFEIHDIIFLFKIRSWIEIFLMIFIVIFTMFLGVETGIIITLGISLLMVLKHTTVPQLSILGRIPGTNKFKDISLFPGAVTQDGQLIIRIEESLFFANIGQVKDLIDRIEKLGSKSAHPSSKFIETPLESFIIDGKNICRIDASAVQVLKEMFIDYKKRNIHICLVKFKPNVIKTFQLAGIFEVLGANCIFPSISSAVDFTGDGYAMKNQL
jgi:MFS superfamily sulfate permease-like transporter